jgi:uncharacterized protein (DUF302 family)
MQWLRNLFALIGVIALIGIGVLGTRLWPIYQAFSSFDDQATTTYLNMFNKIVQTGNGVEATVWKAKVKSGLKISDVEDTMASVANEHNMKNVGELPLSQQVEAMTGKPARFLKIYLYCNPLTAAKMVDYSDAYSAYLPCRITLLEDKTGQLWIYTLNMDMMIHGGKPLPPELKAEATRVKDVIVDIMKRAATGEF